MAQAVIAAAAAAAKWIATAAQAYGTWAAAHPFLAAVVKTGVTIGANYAAQALLAPNVPNSEAAKTALQQTMPPRQYILYRARTSGPYMLWEANKRLYDVYALADQRLHHFGQKWLHDDRVETDAAGKVIKLPTGAYGGHGVWIYTRLGLPTETSYTAETPSGGGGAHPPGPTFSELGTGVWTDSHRGDGVASACLIAMPIEQESFHRVFPNGYPVFSVEQFAGVPDFREETESLDSDAAWIPRGNAALVMAHFLTGIHPAGKGDRFERLIEPQIQSWITAADDCDDLIPLKAGGSEPRYECGGMFNSATHDAEVIARILESCDGWLFQHGDGSYAFEAGVYREPDAVLTAEHIKSIEWYEGQPAQSAVNKLMGSYNSPEHDYALVPADPWIDGALVLEAGEERTDAFPTPWVFSHAQHRRLAKRRLLQLNPLAQGTVVTDLAGLNLWGRRYFKIELADGDWTALSTPTPVEIVGRPRFNPNTLSVEFDVIKVDVAKLNAWNPATEEGVAPEPLDELGSGEPDTGVATPTITSISENGNKLDVIMSGVDPSHAVAVRWRESGVESWIYGEPQAVLDLGGGSTQVTSGNVAQGALLEVSVAAFHDEVWSDWTSPPTEFTTI